MNTAINNLPFITSALESTDREIRGASKLRWNIRGALIWAANALIAARERDVDLTEYKNRLFTLRSIGDTIANDGFSLDIDEAVVRSHLNIENDSDVHAEAIRSARQRVMATRQASRFKEFHRKAVEQLTARRVERAARVADIIDMITSFNDGVYDEASVERDIESFESKLAEVSEQLFWHADARANEAFLPASHTKYLGFNKAAMSMLTTLGITEEDMKRRQTRLNQQLEAEHKAMEASDEVLNAAMDVELASIAEYKPAKTVTRVQAAVA